MLPRNALSIFDRWTKNPYIDTYKNMDEYELASWKSVFEQSIAFGASTRERVLRLRAVNKALENVKSRRVKHAA